ncbi:MAG: polysaccharide deacetylase family protein [Flavipsychrobacter sp.]
MPALTIYSKQNSARLSYVLDWLFRDRLDIDYVIVDRIPVTNDIFISYGAVCDNGISIPDADLLWSTNIEQQHIESADWNGLPTLFAGDQQYSVPFDIFSAIFFLLSRYEEYYSYTPDKHNRYPATESILFKKELLNRPIVDEWVSAFSKLLVSNSIAVKERTFQFLPTYDIDIAWSYKHKGAARTFGAFAKEVLKGNMNNLWDRLKTLFGSKKDPYDSFEWLDRLHEQYKLAPIYFILCAQATSAFDKNIAPTNTAMQNLLKHLANRYSLGIHPSYYIDSNKNLLSEEKGLLENFINKPTSISRQHYIKNKMPDTYRQLLANNITEDYSMGYGTHLGFRAGTGSAFLWFDLEKGEQQNLRVHPFCFMDTTAYYEEKLTTQESFTRLQKMKDKLEETNSTLVTVFHNFSLGTDKMWKGWSEAYERFISECKL